MEVSRTLTKLSADGKTAAWTATFGDSSGKHGAWEMMEVTSTAVILSGLQDKPSTEEMAFKSYGNVAGGKAVVMQLPLSAVTGSTAPTASSATWTKTFDTFFTAKAARALSNGNLACLLYAEDQGASAVMLSSSGATVWGPTHHTKNHGEGTDLQVAADEKSVLLFGHGAPAVGGKGYSGKLTKLGAADGTAQGTKEFTAGGNPVLIYNECWGGVAMKDGSIAIACGTGIEGCGGMTGSDKTDCEAGLGDKRAGAIPRKAGNWQSLVIRADSSGSLLWQRVDSYKDSESPPLASSSEQHRTSSAAEWAVQTSDGGLAVFMDEVNGIGLMKLAVSNGSSSAPSPSPVPPPAWAEIDGASAAGLGQSIVAMSSVLLLMSVGLV